MRFRSFLWLLLLPVLLQGQLLLSAQDEYVDWLSNYKDAIEESKRTQKPIFLEYRCEP